MDYAKVVELEALALQEPMNAIIDRGTSEIQKHFEGSTVLVTGATGFLGKLMLEKLLRSCNLRKIYIIVRSKKGKSIEERITSIIEEPLFDCLRKKKPNFEKKLVPIEGDIAYERLALSDKDRQTLINEVDTIFHYAATTKFDEPLKVATVINVRGTREIISLSRECKKLRVLVHVSTAFSCTTRSRINGDIYEQFYPSPIAPDALIKLVESVDENRLGNIAEGLMEDWPNTYTFTKIVAEELIRTNSEGLPVCIVRPPIVSVPYYEPAPGWIDMHSAMGASGVLLGIGFGIVHVINARDVKFCYAPGDYVTNATIAAGWDTAVECASGRNEIKIYTTSNIRSKKEYSWGTLDKILRLDKESLNLISPKSVWYAYGYNISNKFLYWLLTWILHYIPGYIAEFIIYIFRIKLPKSLPPNFSIIKLYTKIYKIGLLYGYYLTNEWRIHDQNIEDLFTRMSKEDKLIYNFDIEKVDWKNFLYVWCVGLRKYIVKDGLENSEYGRKKRYYLMIVQYLFAAVYAYTVWKIISFFWCIVTFFFN